MDLDYNTRLAAIQRNEKLAQIMQQQAFQPIDIQSYQGIQAPISPLSGLAKVLQAYMGARGTGDEERIKLNQEAKAEAQQMLSGLQDRPASPGRAAVMGMPEIEARPASSFTPMGADVEDNPNLAVAPSGNVETPAVAFQPAVAPQAAIPAQPAMQLTNEEKNKKLEPSPCSVNMTNLTPLIDNNVNSHKELNNEVKLEDETKNSNHEIENHVLKKFENLPMTDKKITHELKENKKLFEENNSKHKNEFLEFSEKKNINDEIENRILNHQPKNVDVLLEKENKISLNTENILENVIIKSEIRNKQSIPSICITKESKYPKENYLSNEICTEQVKSFNNLNEEEKKTSESMNKENEIKIEVAKDLEFKLNIEDKDKILKELLNQNFPYSETDVLNQRKGIIQGNVVKNEEIEEEDLWEIISSKSVDNNVNINIEVEGGLKDNLIILDYFK